MHVKLVQLKTVLRFWGSYAFREPQQEMKLKWFDIFCSGYPDNGSSITVGANQVTVKLISMNTAPFTHALQQCCTLLLQDLSQTDFVLIESTLKEYMYEYLHFSSPHPVIVRHGSWNNQVLILNQMWQAALYLGSGVGATWRYYSSGTGHQKQ